MHKETRTIDGIEYRVLLRRVPEGKTDVRNRRTTKSNGTHENTNRQKETKKESQSPNDGKTSTRTKKKVKK